MSDDVWGGKERSAQAGRDVFWATIFHQASDAGRAEVMYAAHLDLSGLASMDQAHRAQLCLVARIALDRILKVMVTGHPENAGAGAAGAISRLSSAQLDARAGEQQRRAQ